MRNMFIANFCYYFVCIEFRVYIYFPLAPNSHLQNDFTTSICNYELWLIVGDDDSCLTNYLEYAEWARYFAKPFASTEISSEQEMEMVSCAEWISVELISSIQREYVYF